MHLINMTNIAIPGLQHTQISACTENITKAPA